MALELRGFNADRSRFLLTAHSNGNGDATAVRIFEREFADLQRWDRLRRSAKRLPTKRLRKLMATSWVRGDCAAGWRVELQKNVSVCEDWINATFAQLLVPQQQQFLDEELYTATKRKRMALRAERKHARDLQQYFTSAELVELVVERVMQHTRALGDVLWIEPSCGDGRFMTALLQAGARHVVGYEVDEKLHSLAEQDIRQAAEATDSSAQVCLGDFLKSSSSASRDKVVVAVGNPPFGAKGGDGSDLVHHFFRHTAREWRARVIAFIVPERCSRPGFVETTLQQLQPHDTAVSWKLATELPLTDHHFEFGMGDQLQRIRQPSVLQIWSAS